VGEQNLSVWIQKGVCPKPARQILAGGGLLHESMRKAKSKKSICGAGTCFVFFSFSADNINGRCGPSSKSPPPTLAVYRVCATRKLRDPQSELGLLLTLEGRQRLHGIKTRRSDATRMSAPRKSGTKRLWTSSTKILPYCEFRVSVKKTTNRLNIF
jgi:hypothetical protein